MRLFSPAKLNLFFHVLKKRGDGYHEISSLYQAIDLFDVLEIEKSEEDLLSCSDPTLKCDESNLVCRALILFRERFPGSFGVKIHLHKKIPVEAGLGGGSSNAATVLWGLNELQGKVATVEELKEMGALLGSDVPFFFSEGTAHCEGRGEICRPAPFSSFQGWIAKPKKGLSTALVYQNLRVEDFSSVCLNHLEAPAFRLDPSLVQLKEKLKEMGFSSVAMTGSGTSFFCVGDLQPKPIADVTFIPFKTIRRSSSSWYFT